jgi:hypothetical protein
MLLTKLRRPIFLIELFLCCWTETFLPHGADYQQCAADCDHVFDDGGWSIATERSSELRPGAAPAERAYNRADNACDQPAYPVAPSTDGDRCARYCTTHETSPELNRYCAAWRRGELIRDHLAEGEQRQNPARPHIF